MRKKATLALCSMLLGLTAAAELPVGTTPKPVALADRDGGKLDGTAWTSAETVGRITVLFYVDPDEKDMNEHLAAALREEHFPGDRFASVAVINLAASWKPNWLIERILQGKQKKYPRTIYVKDKVRLLVRAWGLADQSYDVILFDRAGKVLFSKDGKLTDAEVAEVIEAIKSRL